jgi:hypothetical protein
MSPRLRTLLAAVLATLVVVGVAPSIARAEDRSGEPVAAADSSEAAPDAPAPTGPPALTSTGSGVDDSVVRLYAAVLGRAPDAGGLAFWVSRYRAGQGLAAIAGALADSAEFRSRYGALNSGDFVKRVYANVLGRDPDPGGYAYWAPRVESGALTRGALLVQFSESREFVALTRTRAPEAPPSVVPANSGSGRRIIYCVSCQQVWLVEASGLLVRHYAVSGRVNTPAPGTYRVFSKSPLAWAGHGGITMQYMVRYTWGQTLALGFHSIPKRPDGSFLQSEAELGQYRSAGCTRQRLEDARFLYEWAPVGTTVVVLS